MKRNIITTGDGSKTIQIEDWNEQYHSIHGAIQEANHVFIKSGLLHFFHLYPKTTHLAILEIGFGTGLNAFLTALEIEHLKRNVKYTALEAYPITDAEISQLNYVEKIDVTKSNLFNSLHTCEWEDEHQLTGAFKLTKKQKCFSELTAIAKYNLIYFDAFGPRVQPELWAEAIFSSMFKSLKPQGVLVTYSAKGSVRRAMQAVGFSVEKIPGPPGKREMLRATKF